MKNRPLAVQIWLVFVALTLGISLLFVLIIPYILKNFFAQEIYATIEESQRIIVSKNLLQRGWEEGFEEASPIDRAQREQSIRTVNHIIFLPRDKTIKTQKSLPDALINVIRNEIEQQSKTEQRYSKRFQDETLFYVVYKPKLLRPNVALVSYMWDSYANALVQTLFKRFVLVLGLVLLISWIPAILLARYLSRPLVIMEKHVKQISDRNWHQPMDIQREDEIGQLAQSIERMRERLVKQDESQQSFLQYISHELKTQVMVIRSYAHSIIDGIYPKGDLPNTMKVIEGEAERLEKRIRDLLYLTKLDYLATRDPIREKVDISSLLTEVVDRFQPRRPELEWDLDHDIYHKPNFIVGDREQLSVAIENLLDNQLRYAKHQVKISMIQEEAMNRTQNREYAESIVTFRIWNDGPPIEQHLLLTLFQKFQKGDQGEFGLGLAIVQRIVTLHKGNVWVANEEGGVAFYVEVPVTTRKLSKI